MGKVQPPPSPSTVYLKNVDLCNLKFPPLPSRNTYDIELTGLHISPSQPTATFINIETSNFKSDYLEKVHFISTLSLHSKYLPTSTMLTKFTETTNFLLDLHHLIIQLLPSSRQIHSHYWQSPLFSTGRMTMGSLRFLYSPQQHDIAN